MKCLYFSVEAFLCVYLITHIYIERVRDLTGCVSSILSLPRQKEDNYTPFAAVSGCLLIVMHAFPECSEPL